MKRRYLSMIPVVGMALMFLEQIILLILLFLVFMTEGEIFRLLDLLIRWGDYTSRSMNYQNKLLAWIVFWIIQVISCLILMEVLG